MLIAPLAGALSDRIGPRPLMVTGLLLQAAGLAWIALIASATAATPTFVPALIIAGVGLSMALPTHGGGIAGRVRPAGHRQGLGVNNTLQRFGGVFGVALVTAVFAANGHLGYAASVAAGFRPALAVSAGLSLAGAASALAVSRNRRRTPVAATQKTPEMVRGGA